MPLATADPVASTLPRPADTAAIDTTVAVTTGAVSTSVTRSSPPSLPDEQPAATAPSTALPNKGPIVIVAIELRAEDPSPGGQYVILANPSEDAVDVNCWTIGSAATGSAAGIVADQPVEAGGALRLIPDTNVFGSPDTVTLFDPKHHVVDATPELSDRAGDDQAWYRDPGGTWTFGRGVALPGELADGRLVVHSTTC